MGRIAIFLASLGASLLLLFCSRTTPFIEASIALPILHQAARQREAWHRRGPHARPAGALEHSGAALPSPLPAFTAGLGNDMAALSALDSQVACQREAWATLYSSGVAADWIRSKTYFVATLVLKNSVRKFEKYCPGRQFLLLHNRSLSEADRWAVAALQNHGFSPLPLSMEVPYYGRSDPNLSIGWLKLAVFNMTNFDRIVILDADMLAVGPLEDGYFPRGTMSTLSLITSPMPRPNPQRSVNIGVMSIGPSTEVFDKMLTALHSFDSRADKPDDQDEGWIEMFFRKWGAFQGVYVSAAGSCVEGTEYQLADATLGLNRSSMDGIGWCFHLPEYNMYVSGGKEVAALLERTLTRTRPKLLHWPGGNKPWCIVRADRSVFDQMWWDAAKSTLNETLDGYRSAMTASCGRLAARLRRSPLARQKMRSERKRLSLLWRGV